MKDKDVISTYSSITENFSKTEGCKEIKHNLLHELLQPYLRVSKRVSFFISKDTTNKFKLRNKSGEKNDLR